eukprot:TRINITY_DN20607_c0_g1_i1.p1 TRINITY_DN20607_c0_g1~~TRINITY_DN20607_c0_g1_i1.p1  ORF type:complete len:148 (+),score=27.22 TRINITY_DN20607_c0_g1_i1:60-446(+)
MKLTPGFLSELSYNDAGSGFDAPTGLSLPGGGGSGGGGGGGGGSAPSLSPPSSAPAGSSAPTMGSSPLGKGGWFKNIPKTPTAGAGGAHGPTDMTKCISSAAKFMTSMHDKGCLSNSQISSIRTVLHL